MLVVLLVPAAAGAGLREVVSMAAVALAAVAAIHYHLVAHFCVKAVAQWSGCHA